MALTNDDYPALKTELETDPNGYTFLYPGDPTRDNAIADAATLNLIRTNIKFTQNEVDMKVLFENIVPGEFQSGQAAKREWMNFMVTAGSTGQMLDVSATSNAKAGLEDMFGAQTTTNTNLQENVFQRSGSRCEQLFGEGEVAYYWDIERAMALP